VVSIKALLHTIQKFPLVPLLTNKFVFLKGLVECDFCLGCWLYFGGNLIFKIKLLGIENVPILSEFLLGILLSLIVHLISIGWKEKFGVIHFE
jgi:uncharacterized protein with PQ loop repeat